MLIRKNIFRPDKNSMTKKEKKLVLVFLVILGVGMIAQGIPFAIKYHQAGVDKIDEIRLKRSRLKKLYENQLYWVTEYKKNSNKEKKLKKQLFEGYSPELIAGRVQGRLKTLARQNGIKVDSMSLADFKQVDNWLLITQTMSFKSSSKNVVKLLESIKRSVPTLIVNDVQIRAYRKTLNCTLKVVGFSRTDLDKKGSDT
jgi:hypothetical protein